MVFVHVSRCLIFKVQPRPFFRERLSILSWHKRKVKYYFLFFLKIFRDPCRFPLKNIFIFFKIVLDIFRNDAIIATLPQGACESVGVDWPEGPPVPIPNTEVKLRFVDDSMRATACENR